MGTSTHGGMTFPRRRWNVIYNAVSNRCHPPTSPNTVPATKSHCHDWSLSHMKHQTAYCHCTRFCVRLSYNSTRLLVFARTPTRLTKSFTWRRSGRVKRRRSERANPRRSERCTSLRLYCCILRHIILHHITSYYIISLFNIMSNYIIMSC